jgi:hypothetical protein
MRASLFDAQKKMSFFDASAYDNLSSSSSDDTDDEETVGVVKPTGGASPGVETTRRDTGKDDDDDDFDASLKGNKDTPTTLPSASDVVRALDGSNAALEISELVASHAMRPTMREVAKHSIANANASASVSYYSTGGGRKPTSTDTDDEKRAATIGIGVHRVMFLEHRVAVRLTTNEGNGMGDVVKSTGARVTLDEFVSDEDDDEEIDEKMKRRVTITGSAADVAKCERFIENLVREYENRAMKRFYCPKIVLGAFIGRGYGHVKKIEGISKCKIVISDVDKVHEGSTHEVVRAIEVTGTPAQVSLGYKLALQQLDEAMKTAPDVDEMKAGLRRNVGFDIDEERKKKPKRK